MSLSYYELIVMNLLLKHLPAKNIGVIKLVSLRQDGSGLVSLHANFKRELLHHINTVSSSHSEWTLLIILVHLWNVLNQNSGHISIIPPLNTTQKKTKPNATAWQGDKIILTQCRLFFGHLTAFHGLLRSDHIIKKRQEIQSPLDDARASRVSWWGSWVAFPDK